ncbi:MAG: FAD-binding protein, partial [Sphaerobacteraceae bacterium]
SYTVQQYIYENLPLGQLWDHFDEIMSSGYSVSLFASWQEEEIEQLWIKQIATPGQQTPVASTLFGARLATVTRHPSPGKPEGDCTEQLGTPGPWHERLPHFRMDAIGPHGDDLQTEYFVNRKQATHALRALVQQRELIAPIIKTSEIRSMAGDDIWMSMAYGRDTVGIHFSWNADLNALMERLPELEEVLAPYDPRPHWGKLSTIPKETVASRYPKFGQFRSAMRRYDPDGTFQNEFLSDYVLNIA